VTGCDGGHPESAPHQHGHPGETGDHGHGHGVTAGSDARLITIALALISGFLVFEVVMAFAGHSLALLADAGHMLTDAGALGASLLAIRLARRPASGVGTFGFKRAEVLSAQANGITWALGQRQALELAGVRPPSVNLEDTDLAAARWLDQREVGWIMLISSLAKAHTATVVKPVEPVQLVAFTLQWNPDRAQTTAVARFVHAALTADPPPGWLTQPGHLRHQAGTVGKP